MTGEPKTFDSIAAVLLTTVAISPARSVLSGRGARKPCVITGSVRERLISGSYLSRLFSTAVRIAWLERDRANGDAAEPGELCGVDRFGLGCDRR